LSAATKVSRWLICVLFIAAGVNHYVSPDVYLMIMPEYLPWPLLRYPLDYVFHSDDFRVAELEVLPSIGSDHFPLWIVLSHEPDAEDAQEAPDLDAGDREDAQEAVDAADRDDSTEVIER